jgi:hypothetical protein
VVLSAAGLVAEVEVLGELCGMGKVFTEVLLQEQRSALNNWSQFLCIWLSCSTASSQGSRSGNAFNRVWWLLISSIPDLSVALPSLLLV